MIQTRKYLLKIADTKEEFEQIHRLNYKTFTEEIPQHERDGSGSLIDLFHSENTYIIALDGGCLAGMMAVRGIRPFSLDYKIPDLDDHLPAGRRICEIRLLAIEKEHRGTLLFFLLMNKMAEFCVDAGYDYAIISGTTMQQKLYRHMGFTPISPKVGKPGAYFIPMGVSIETFRELLDKHRNEKG